MRTRWSAYAGVSVALAGGVVVKALAQRPNFYSAAVYLSQSSANLMILTNVVFVAACTFLLGLQKFLYGPLRPIEIEQLYEKAWFAVTETCLAMTIFRGEIGAWFLVMFFALLAGKVWAWIGEGRVEVLEQQPPRNPRLFHTRLALSLGLSVLFDLTMLEYVVKEVTNMARPDMMVMFGFEFAVLSIVSLSTAARYAINLVELGVVRGQKSKRMDEIRKARVEVATREAEQILGRDAAQLRNLLSTSDASTTADTTNARSEGPSSAVTIALNSITNARDQPVDDADLEVEGWESKGRWIFYLDLATDFFKLVVYLSFFFILLIFYGLPIHILRDVFMTCRSFIKRIADFMRYRTATRNMNDRYPDATDQDIGREDVCIICREEMRPYQPAAAGTSTNPAAERMRPKKLPCGHILHFSCLRSWLERQQICPTCRTSVVPPAQAPTGSTANGAGQAANGHNGHPPRNDIPRGRVFQIGPLRVGFGAARGNVLENLQQQLGDPQAPLAPPADGTGVQQYGFGIRWEGMRRRDRQNRSRSHRRVADQLDSAERSIRRELAALSASAEELRIMRDMETQLARLRAMRQGANLVQGAATATQPLPHPGLATTPRETSFTSLVGNRQVILNAGSDRLPAGLILPEGWTIMPLHPQHGVNFPLAPQTTTASVPQPASAMFTMPGPVPQPFPQAAVAGPGLNILPHLAHLQAQATTGLPGHADVEATQQTSRAMPAQVAGDVNGVHDIARNMSNILAEQVRNLHNNSQVIPGPDRAVQSQARAADTPTTTSVAIGAMSSVPSAVESTSSPAGETTSRTVSSTLPMWGSAAELGADSSTRPVSQSRIDTTGDRTVEHGTSSHSRENVTEPVRQRRSATVEDLVEDPD